MVLAEVRLGSASVVCQSMDRNEIRKSAAKSAPLSWVKSGQKQLRKNNCAKTRQKLGLQMGKAGKNRYFVLKNRYFVLKNRYFVLKNRYFVLKNRLFCIEESSFSIEDGKITSAHSRAILRCRDTQDPR